MNTHVRSLLSPAVPAGMNAMQAATTLPVSSFAAVYDEAKTVTLEGKRR